MAKRRYSQPQKRFTREWWVRSGHNFFWVALVTVLVWVYADMEFTEEKDLKATLRMVTREDTDLKILSRTDVPLSFTVKANRKTLDTFSRWLNARGGIIEYDVSQDFGPGEHNISTITTIQSIAGRQGTPITVLSSSTPTTKVDLDRLLRKTVAVKFDKLGGELASPAVLEPAKVPIRVGENDWKQIMAKSAGEEPFLATIQANLANTPADEPQTRQVDLVGTIAGVRVEPLIKQVNVTFTVKRLTDTGIVKVAVGIKMPPAWCEDKDDTWKRYFLKRKEEGEWLAEIIVSGSVQDLQKLQGETNKISAYITLVDDDKKPLLTWLKREVVVELPPGLQVKLAGSAPSVNFKLIERTAPATPLP